MYCHGFPPIAVPDSWILILGTMPGKISLREQQYYAHPQNAFWKFAAEILGFDAASPYFQRVASLKTHGVAVWDVLKSCTRESSLDSDIDPSSIVPNDFKNFYAAHPAIRRVCFNGAKAAALYTRYVQPHLQDMVAVEHLRLPSTSPANVRIPRAEKRDAWRVINQP